MPADISPHINALLIMRDTVSESRLQTTVDPAPIYAPNAAPSLAANSGLISMFEIPVTVEFVNNSRSHWSSHTRLRVTVAPSSTTFSGQSLTFERMVVRLPMTHWSLMKTFSAMTVSSPMMHFVPITSEESSVRAPIWVPLQMTELLTTEPGSISQLSPTTVLASMAPGWMREFLPTMTVPWRFLSSVSIRA